MHVRILGVELRDRQPSIDVPSIDDNTQEEFESVGQALSGAGKSQTLKSPAKGFAGALEGHSTPVPWMVPCTMTGPERALKLWTLALFEALQSE